MRLALLSFFALLSAGLSFGADITGNWKGQLTTPNGDAIEIKYDFKQDGNKLTGTVIGPQGDPSEISEGKVENEKISFILNVSMNGGMKLSHTGTISGDTISLQFQFGDQPAMTVKLSRATP